MDEPATTRKRQAIRDSRKARAVPFKQWWQQERQRIEAKENMTDAVVDMWRSSMELSPDYAKELKAFWALPEEFTF